MPCLLVLLAVIAPRVVAVVLWLFTHFFDKAFSDRLLLLIGGVLLLPFTTLAYAWAYNREGGVHSTPMLILIVVAVIADLGGLVGSRRGRG